MRKVTELISNEYQRWEQGIYLVNAPMSSGKSQFVLNDFYTYTQSQNKRFAMFVNRTILRDQLLSYLQGKDIFVSTYQKLEFNNYLQSICYTLPLTAALQDLMAEMKQLDYLVLDECHYIFQDSEFNRYTDTIMNLVDEFSKEKPVLMLSATPQLVKKFYGSRITKEYYLKPDYKYIDKVIVFNPKKDLDQIIAQIPSGERILYFGNNKLRLKEYAEQFPNSAFVSSDNKDESAIVKQIVSKNAFDCRMLFSTKVLDNGINLIDGNLKHIFIDLDDLVTAIQCLGRKRIAPGEKIILYVADKPKGFFNLKWQKLKEDEVIYKDFHNMPIEVFAEKYRRKELPYFLDNEETLIKPAELYFNEGYRFVESIMNKETTFLQELLRLLGIKRYTRFHSFEIEKFLELNRGKRFYIDKGEHEKIIAIINLRRNGVLKRSLGLLNAYLDEEDIPYKIVSERGMCRKSPDFKKTYWKICPKN